MITAIIVLTTFGVIAGSGLAMASKKFSVEKDPKVEMVLNNLPGVNCGACGFPGCSAMSEAITSGRAAPNGCPVCSPEMIHNISNIIGVASHKAEKQIPRLICAGGKDTCKSLAAYEGPTQCNIMDTILGGGKSCSFGCMGGGDCVTVCPANAIHLNHKNLPQVDEINCISCGLCIKKCPRNLLSMKPISKKVTVCCSSKDKGADVRKICSVGCIGCGICEKLCQTKAISITDNLANIDAEKCTLCGSCVYKCPTKSIQVVG